MKFLKNNITYFTKRIILFFPLLIFLGKRSLLAYDEGFYALQAKWILQNNDWITPTKWGAIETDRTISVQFLIALSQKVFGQNIFAIYIPNILFGILMIFLTYKLHLEILNKKRPIISALILSTTFLWINYFHMATQDLIFSSIITLGIYSSVKSHKDKKNIFYLLSGLWIGLAFMIKTYLVAVPFIAILPFFWNYKIFKNIYFWIGLILGFLPFTIWSFEIVSLHGWDSFSGLYKKLISLSEQNTFTNPFYFYLWNFIINSLPWSLFSILGFLKVAKKENKLSNYFLYKYPIFVIILLSLFSTKTPYYPLQILSLTSINAYLGINYIFSKKDILSKNFIKLISFVIPVLVLILIVLVNAKNYLKDFDTNTIIFLNIAFISYSFCWFMLSFAKKSSHKLIFVLLGPYLLTSFIVFSGVLSDRSKSIRVATQEAIEENYLKDRIVEVISSEIINEDIDKKIIKIAIFTPKLANNKLKSIEDLKPNNYAWTVLPENQNLKKTSNYEILYDSKILDPWKLIIKR